MTKAEALNQIIGNLCRECKVRVKRGGKRKGAELCEACYSTDVLPY